MSNEIIIDSEFVSGTTDKAFFVKFKGTSKRNVNKDTLYEMIRNYYNDKNIDDMLNNVCFLKTIFRNCNFDYLECVSRNDGSNERVIFNNKDLSYFEHIDSLITFKYDKTYDIKVNSDEDESIEVSDLFKKVFNLKYCGLIPFRDDAKELTEIYSLFYDKDPDYSSHKIMEECQLMMSFLKKFDISLYNDPFSDTDSSFQEVNKFDYPICWDLYDLVKSLYPYGLVDYYEYSPNLTDRDRYIIKTSGLEIRDNYRGFYLRYLKNFSNILYKSNYRLSDDYDSNSLSIRTKSQISTVNECKRLIKTINKEADKNESLNN